MLIFGDSHAVPILAKDHPTWVVEGHDGLYARDMPSYLETALKEAKYETVVLLAGTNDLHVGSSEVECVTVAFSIATLVQQCVRSGVQCVKVFPPWTSEAIQDRVADALTKIIQKKKLTQYLDICFYFPFPSEVQEDGIHLTLQGNQELAIRIQK